METFRETEKSVPIHCFQKSGIVNMQKKKDQETEEKICIAVRDLHINAESDDEVECVDPEVFPGQPQIKVTSRKKTKNNFSPQKI